MSNLDSATDSAGEASMVSSTHNGVEEHILSRLFLFAKGVYGNAVLKKCLAKGISDSIKRF